MAIPPPCTTMGPQCGQVEVTLRIANRGDDSPTLQDAASTWLLGHTQRITFGTPFVEGGEILVDATVHVPCKYLEAPRGQGCEGRCKAHGFEGRVPAASREEPVPPVKRNGRDVFHVSFRGEHRWLVLPLTRQAERLQRRGLPVLNDNPCAGAPCRTADNTRGAACCRDLTLDVVAPPGDEETELLLRARRAPYVCKVERSDPTTLECEVISACAYLDPDDSVSCVLHDRLLPNHQLAKPSICREWPDLGEDEVAHPGCRLVDDA